MRVTGGWVSGNQTVHGCGNYFRMINRDILDEVLSEMLRNVPPDVVYSDFFQAFFRGAIRMFQRDNEMRNMVLSDPEARDKATRHFFNRALREVRENA